MSEPIDIQATETVSPYPVPVDISGATYTLLDPEGEPSGPRVQLPDGRVTALHAHGGALDHLTETELATLIAAVPAPVE